jgi:hypothetical protein
VLGGLAAPPTALIALLSFFKKTKKKNKKKKQKKKKKKKKKRKRKQSEGLLRSVEKERLQDTNTNPLLIVKRYEKIGKCQHPGQHELCREGACDSSCGI